MQEIYYISCDWGTSNLRVRLVEKLSNSISAHLSGPGVKEVNTRFNNGSVSERFDYFNNVLLDTLRLLQSQTGLDLSGTPIVISGMASSSIGMRELAYSEVPCELQSQLGLDIIEATPGFPFPLILVSGVRSTDDVIRGEETQILGCMKVIEADTFRIILPGTHSKHAQVHAGVLNNFSTYMTGEVFNLLTTQSILSASVQNSRDNVEVTIKSFEDGVRESVDSSLLHQAFLVRTNSLFNKYSPSENFFYLSGLLIGNELKNFVLTDTERLLICGDAGLVRWYKQALQILNISNDAAIIDAESAVLAAHRHFLTKM